MHSQGAWGKETLINMTTKQLITEIFTAILFTLTLLVFLSALSLFQ